MADNNGYAPNPSNKRFQDMIDAEFSASRKNANSSNAPGSNPDLDPASEQAREARDRQNERLRHDYMGQDASDLGANTGSNYYNSSDYSANNSSSAQSAQSTNSSTQETETQSALQSSSASDQPNRWATSVTGNNQTKSKKRSIVTFLKKRGATIAILLSLIAGGGFMLGAPTMQGFAVVNRFIQEFNSMSTVNFSRSNFFLRKIFNTASSSQDSDSVVKGTVFDSDNFKLGDKEVASLKNNNINVAETDLSDGTKLRYLTYEQNGRTYKIVGDADAVTKATNLPDLDGAIDLTTAKASVPDFDNRFTAATIEFSSQSSGWYDKITTRLLTKLGLSRNRFADTSPEEDMEDFKNVAKNQKEANGIGVDGEAREYVDEDVEGDDIFVDENGNKYRIDKTQESASSDKINIGDDDATISQKLTSKANSIARSADQGINIACTVMTIAGAINDMANAAELLQVLNFANGFMNSVQQVQAGQGSNAQMNHYLTLLNTKDSKTNLTAMQSEGMSQVFGSKVNGNDESIQKFNFEKSQHSILNGTIPIQSMTIDALMGCSYGRMAVSGVKLAAKGVAFAASFVTGGGASIAAWFGEKLLGTVVNVVQSAAITLTVSKIVEVALPSVATFLARDLITDTLGPDLGNALAVGGRNYLGSNHKQRGGSGASEEALAAFHQETNNVIAHQAKYERETKSPLDPTSQYTFLGSLYNSFLPVFSGGSIFSNLANFSTAITSSMAGLMPKAAALSMDNTYLTRTKGENCPVSDDMGVVSDVISCSPIMASDTNTFQIDPAELLRTVNSLNPNNFKHESDGSLTLKDGNPVINPSKDSDLYRFATICGQRQINYGFADGSVASSLTSSGSGALDTLITGAGNAVDTVGDVQNFMEALVSTSEKGWISGQYCVNTSKNPRWNSEMRYYQRYLEDQSVLESMDIVKESSLIAALEEWDKQNPINDYQDLLAYYSGHSREEVQLALDFVDYYDTLAEYRPKNMAPLPLEKPYNPYEFLLNQSNLTVIQMEQPLVAGTSELEREVAFRQDKRSVNQSI